MKAARIRAFAAVTVCFLLAVSATQAADIVNPGFENGWDGWTRGDADGSGSAISEDTHSGAQSAKLTRESVFVAQPVDVVPGSSYQLSAFVKGAGTVGVKVGSDIFFEQLSNKTRKWKQLTVTFQSGDAERATVFGSFIGVEGRFDDFSFVRIDGESHQPSTHIISSSGGGHGLSPELPPGRNFDLLGWYLNTPADDDNDDKSDRFSEITLVSGFEDPRYFYTADDGGMVFRTTIGGARTSKNTRFTRTELREMLRRGETGVNTRNEDRSPNRNNWVFSSAPAKAQQQAGAVDGVLRATLAVNHVTSSGKPAQVGEVVIGQIHAASDEPARLYYRKFPGHNRGSVYVAHEPSGGDDVYTDLLGTRSVDTPDPDDGIALNEKFSYEIAASGHDLHIVISQRDKLLAETRIDMTDSGYDVANDYMYFKAGAYNQNDSGDPDDFVQVTFYELEARHD
jgi:poly(beta-D-mannuronate) lyase